MHHSRLYRAKRKLEVLLAEMQEGVQGDPVEIEQLRQAIRLDLQYLDLKLNAQNVSVVIDRLAGAGTPPR